ncbi:hypothetical protein LJR219_002308 [Phenylobacterium sp. LjRoot219]|uniref:glycosyltransferase family 9 protein n=1 Tax=Phenylobacterium sp. LjRoot219 TaxID=3342283 RepID=UPI003ECD6D60
MTVSPVRRPSMAGGDDDAVTLDLAPGFGDANRMSATSDTKADLLARTAELRDAGDVAAGRRLLRAAAPGDAELLRELGDFSELDGDLAAAEACFRDALALAPDAMPTARRLGKLLLSQGRYAEGFALFEVRHQLDALQKPPLPYPEWRGEAVAGRRILIWPEQGLGDQIQFARFAPILQARGADVTVICLPALARLFADSLGVRVIPARGEVEFPDPDAWVMTCSLAGRMGVTPETIPAAPYLRAARPWPRPLPAGLKVGVMTNGNPVNANDRNRSLPAEAAAALRRLPAQVVDLHPAATGATDFADTASLMAQLDLVISVDTSVAHLAGALGKPCWLLLPVRGLDWRWMRERRDSPWYPTMRLYRQTTPDDWGPVLREIEADLAAWPAQA